MVQFHLLHVWRQLIKATSFSSFQIFQMFLNTEYAKITKFKCSEGKIFTFCFLSPDKLFNSNKSFFSFGTISVQKLAKPFVTSVGSEVSFELTLKDLLGRGCLFFCRIYSLNYFPESFRCHQKVSSSKFWQYFELAFLRQIFTSLLLIL